MSDQGEGSAGPTKFDRYQRWRLILGKRVEDQMSAERAKAGCGAAGAPTLTREMGEMDGALGAIYDIEEPEPGAKPKKRSAGLGAGKGAIAKWLGDVRKYFERDVVTLI